eukprot:6172917-Pleurochrysis_carterae.AAC.1
MTGKTPSDKLRMLHKELTKAAAEVAGIAPEKNRGGGIRGRKMQLHLYHARRYTGGKGKKGGFWRRKEIRQDYIMNKLGKDDRRARRARVIEICEEAKERTEEQLRGIRKEMKKTTNTDALIQSLMKLGKGTGNVVIR